MRFTTLAGRTSSAAVRRHIGGHHTIVPTIPPAPIVTPFKMNIPEADPFPFSSKNNRFRAAGHGLLRSTPVR
jgi:hypothetical protein